VNSVPTGVVALGIRGVFVVLFLSRSRANLGAWEPVVLLMRWVLGTLKTGQDLFCQARSAVL